MRYGLWRPDEGDLHPVDWTCDPIGRPNLAGIHDASLTRLTLDAEARTLELRLRGAGGERLRFAFGDVAAIGGDGLREAAIVNTIFVWPVLSVPPAFHDDRSAGWRHLLASRGTRPEELAAERHRLSCELAHGFLSTIVCSYGGDLSVLAGTLLIDEAC